MSLSSEKNIDLGYDTDVMRNGAQKFGDHATKLRTLRDEMQTCLDNLTSSDWTTKAGVAFAAMVESNWSDNMKNYAGLLEMLQKALNESADKYDELTADYIEKTKIE